MPTSTINQKLKESSPSAQILPPFTAELTGVKIALDCAKAKVPFPDKTEDYIPVVIPTVISNHQLAFLMENVGPNKVGVLYYGTMIRPDFMVVYGEVQIKDKYHFNLIGEISSDSKKVSIGISLYSEDYSQIKSGMITNSGTSYFNCKPSVKLIPHTTQYKACRVEGIRSFSEGSATIKSHPNFAANASVGASISFEPKASQAAAPKQSMQMPSKENMDMLNERQIEKENREKVITLLSALKTSADKNKLPSVELALRRAAAAGNLIAVKDLILLVKDIRINEAGSSQKTALDYAKEYNKNDVFQFLSDQLKERAIENTTGEQAAPIKQKIK